MAQIGADVEALDQLAQRMEQEAERITQASTALTAQLNSTWWQGTDANQFKSDWEGTYNAQLVQICEALRQTGQRARTEAEQQRQASAA